MKTIPAPTCHHLFPDNHRCGSPSLRGEAFCFFHHPDRKPVATISKPTPARPRKKGTSATKPMNPNTYAALSCMRNGYFAP